MLNKQVVVRLTVTAKTSLCQAFRHLFFSKKALYGTMGLLYLVVVVQSLRKGTDIGSPVVDEERLR